MTIDERIEKLAERHEALIHVLKLRAAENLSHGMPAENRDRDRRMGEVMEGIAKLLHVAEIHEQRIERPES